MKAEHRHELKTNELADWIANFPQWLKENQTSVIVGAIIVIGLIAYTIFFYGVQGRAWEQRQMQITALLDQLGVQKDTVLMGQVQGLSVSDIFLNTAGGLATAAEEAENPRLAALAMIKRAEALRTELHYRPVQAEADVQKYQLEQARSVYQQAMDKGKGDPQIEAMAQYGIGLCLEDMGDFNEAKKIYEKIADSAEYAGTSFPTRAKFRMQIMDDFKSQIVFAEAPKPVQQPIEPNMPLLLEMPLTDVNKSMPKEPELNLPAQ